MHYGSNTAKGGVSICNMFSNFFHSNFTTPSPLLSYPALNFSSTQASITSINITIQDVTNSLRSLDITKSAGPDNLPPIFLLRCAETISLPIYLLFKKSFSEFTMPSVWKSAFISPVHKKGKKSDVTNYRPISKLCILAKLFEKIVYN
jgi:hypothetical protein